MLFNIEIGEILPLKDEDGNEVQAEVFGVYICGNWEMVIVKDHMHGTDGFVAHVYATGYPVRGMAFPSIEEAKSRLHKICSNKDFDPVENHVQYSNRIFSADALRPIFHVKRKTEDGCRIIYFNETPKGYNIVVMEFAGEAKEKLFSKHFSRSNALLVYQDAILAGYRDHYRLQAV